MRKEIRDFLNQPKDKKRHNSSILSGARRNPNRPPAGFNHWPTFDEIVQVLSKRVEKKEDKELINKLNEDFKVELKLKAPPEKDEALEKLLRSLNIK